MTAALAELCEQAMGPDREIDRSIELSLPGVLPHPYDGDKPAGQWASVISGVGHPDFLPGQGYSSPAYTASLDAAMRLAGDYGFDLQRRKKTANASLSTSPGLWVIGSARTPALAMCAAALKARACDSGSDRNGEDCEAS